MTNIELYINEILVDTGKSFSVRLNRQLINPAELNTKDAQYSYSISLPPTVNNHKALGFANVEEVKGKFNKIYRAQLLINSVRIFIGNFRLSEVSRTGYKGNLYIPVAKSIKDIFGDINLNKLPEYRIPFKDYATSVTAINTAALTTPQIAIFPYILYGLLPKVSLDKNANSYSARDVWDSSVRVNMQDVPPSINPLLMLKHIFNSQGFELVGTAFNDTRLTQLYQSYRNATDYVQPWNYGYHAKVKIKGEWSSTRNKRYKDSFQFERGVNQSTDDYPLYSADLFDSTNASILIEEDTGGNVLYKEVKDEDNVIWSQTQLRIPASGFYKVRFDASLRIYDNNNWRSTDPSTGVQHVSGDSSKRDNKLWHMVNEIRLIRDRKSGDFGLHSAKIDGKMYYDNQAQNQIWDDQNIPKYFPIISEGGQIVFVDLNQDRNILLGFSFGGRYDDVLLQNPTNKGVIERMLVAKPALSWNSLEKDNLNKLAVNSPGYQRWGFIEISEEDEDGEGKYLDYGTGDLRENSTLDNKGNIIKTDEDNGNLLLFKFPLKKHYTYQLNLSDNYNEKIFIHDINNSNFIKEFIPQGGILKFTIKDALAPTLTLYIRTSSFDISESLRIKEYIDEENADIIEWTPSNKYKINLANSPANYIKRGFYKNQPADSAWHGQGNLNAVIWLEAGELISVASVSSEGAYRRSGMSSTHGWTNHEVAFNLEIEPFRIDDAWLKVDYQGRGTDVMDWNDPVNFDVNSINLVGFLPSDVKANDYIDNFVKAYNLKLTQIGTNIFSLDVKQRKTAVTTLSINLDDIASINDRTNTPLGLPSKYKLGFTINTDEEGYFLTNDDGGGEYLTGSIEDTIIEQKSNFSYNWFKNITKVQAGGNLNLAIPIISKHEVWTGDASYSEAMTKRYSDLPTRFWYLNGILEGDYILNGKSVSFAKVSNDLPGGDSVLNYKNVPNTILSNYFTVLGIGSESHYTEAEAFLTPYQYNNLDGSYMVKFNGDLYYAAELEGYDPTNKNKTKLKLILKI